MLEKNCCYVLSYVGFAPEAGNLEAHATTRAKIDYQHHKLHKSSRLLKEPAQLRSCEICKASDLIKLAYPHHQASQWRLMQRPRAVWTEKGFCNVLFLCGSRSLLHVRAFISMSCMYSWGWACVEHCTLKSC